MVGGFQICFLFCLSFRYVSDVSYHRRCFWLPSCGGRGRHGPLLRQEFGIPVHYAVEEYARKNRMRGSAGLLDFPNLWKATKHQ